jgi:glycosyltransferase involved in cell wall biosynthesis
LNNGFRSAYNIGDKFIVSYAGVIGLAQGVESLLNAAKDFRKNSNVHFVLAGGGLGYKAIKEQAIKEGLENILFLPHLIEHEYIKLLRSSDVCLVTLVQELKTPVVPGKLQSIMAVGRPVICSVPSISDAKTMIKEANCGFWVDPSDKTGLSKAINTLLQNESREYMGKFGREYAQRFFEKKACIEAYLDLLKK